LGRESYHPNALGHELIEQAILRQTHNLTDGFGGESTPDSTSSQALLSAPKTGRQINTLVPTAITTGLAGPGQSVTLSVNGASAGLKSQTSYTIHLDGPDGPTVDTTTSDSNGDVASTVTIPSDTEPGGHTINVAGDGETDEPIDVMQPIYVSASDNDADGDGVADTVDSCPTTVNSGQDADQDGIDDACDGFIGQSPAGNTQNDGDGNSSSAGASSSQSGGSGDEANPPDTSGSSDSSGSQGTGSTTSSPPPPDDTAELTDSQSSGTAEDNPPAGNDSVPIGSNSTTDDSSHSDSALSQNTSSASQSATAAPPLIETSTTAAVFSIGKSSPPSGQPAYQSSQPIAIDATLGTQTTNPNSVKARAIHVPVKTSGDPGQARRYQPRIISWLPWSLLCVILILLVVLFGILMSRLSQKSNQREFAGA
ncbi:MAG: thrombospondin type 3 repeat-containing protein, partial [Candidatus Saccharimonadales bacterium]